MASVMTHIEKKNHFQYPLKNILDPCMDVNMKTYQHCIVLHNDNLIDELHILESCKT